MTTKIAIRRAYGSKNGISKTVTLKYSSSLNEKPIGSLSLISPEKINNTPTNILEIVTNSFIVIYLNVLMQKQHN